ncbi:MAG: ABC transporter permease, partial [Candidatus Diapherotrites archaeon]|nr:ABC transporter permease [Candidatus Diapherotrites archaeon]
MATVQNLSEKVSLVKNSISPVLTVLDDASTKLKESGQEELALQIGGVHDAVNAQVLELEKINSDLKSIESDLNETEQKMLAATEKLLLADSRLDTAKQSIDELKENIFELQSIIDETSIALKKSAQSRRALRQDLIDAKNLLEGLILQLSAIKNYSPEFLSSPVQVSIEPLYEFSRVTALVPFTIALVLLLTCLLLSSTSMINEQNWGIIFRLKSSPTGFASWLAGKMLGQAIIALFETILIFAVAILLFGVLLPNDILGVFFAVFISALAFASIGIWITNFMKTTSNSIFTSLLLIVPMIFLSGIIVPIEFMPPFLDFIARILPFTASIDLIQGIYLRKVSALEMGFTIIPLAVITVFCTLWTYFYRKKKLL